MEGDDSRPASTVLVVDDEPDLADLYATTLGDRYEVRVAYGGREALDAVDRTVDVTLLDRRMPDLSGDAVLERLRNDGYRCRVVMVTAVDPDVDVVSMPFEAYLTKPVGPEELVEAVNEQLIYASYDRKIREYTRVRSKIELLRTELPPEDLERDDRFERLRARADSIRAEVESLFEDHEELDPLRP